MNAPILLVVVLVLVIDQAESRRGMKDENEDDEI